MTFATRQSVTWSLIGQYPVGVLLWPTILYDIGWHRLGSLYYYIAVRLPEGQRDKAFEVSDILSSDKEKSTPTERAFIT